jgi:hypothetical protein
MTGSEVAAALRALADKIAAPAPQQRPQAPAAPAPTGSGVNGVVAFWDVKVRDNGKPMASLKLATGERFPCFDEKVIAAVDPLVKGQSRDRLYEAVGQEGRLDRVLACGGRSQAQRHPRERDPVLTNTLFTLEGGQSTRLPPLFFMDSHDTPNIQHHAAHAPRR